MRGSSCAYIRCSQVDVAIAVAIGNAIDGSNTSAYAGTCPGVRHLEHVGADVDDTNISTACNREDRSSKSHRRREVTDVSSCKLTGDEYRSSLPIHKHVAQGDTRGVDVRKVVQFRSTATTASGNRNPAAVLTTVKGTIGVSIRDANDLVNIGSRFISLDEVPVDDRVSYTTAHDSSNALIDTDLRGQFDEHGAVVIGADRRASTLEEDDVTLNRLLGTGVSPQFFTADQCSRELVGSLVQRLPVSPRSHLDVRRRGVKGKGG